MKREDLLYGRTVALLVLFSFLFLPQLGYESIVFDQPVSILGFRFLVSSDFLVTILGWLTIVCLLTLLAANQIEQWFSRTLGTGFCWGLTLLRASVVVEPDVREMLKFGPRFGFWVTAGFLVLLLLLSKSYFAPEQPKAEEAPQDESETDAVLISLGPAFQEWRSVGETIVQWLQTRSGDRVMVAVGISIACAIMGIKWLITIGQLDQLSGRDGFWLGLQFPIWLYGIYWLIRQHHKKEYPFDSPS